MEDTKELLNSIFSVNHGAPRYPNINNMYQTSTLSIALHKNTNNPKLAWRIFKRIIISSSNSNPDYIRSIPIITRILIQSNMLIEIDYLPQLLQNSQTSEKTTFQSLISLIQILAKSRIVEKAVTHFQSLRAHYPKTIPDVFVYNLLIKSSLLENRVEFVQWLYKDMIVSGVLPQTYTFNLLITALCDSGRLNEARDVFDKMSLKGCVPNEFSFGILVRGYCRNGLALNAVVVLDKMGSFGLRPNRVIYNTLISSFCKEGMTDEAEKMVKRMRDEDGLLPDVVTFNSRISALSGSGKILEASRIFRDMQIDRVLGLPKPNAVTYNLMLDGFCKAGMLEESETLVMTMKSAEGGLMKIESYNIWLLGLVRNGELLATQLVLKEMVDKGIQPNIYSYNIVMDGLCKSGMLSDARTLINLMVNTGVFPDTVTYSTLIHGYCTKKKVLEANNVLHEMMKNNCEPNMYTCNILLHSLWKEYKIGEAEKLIQKMNERGYVLDTVTCNIVIDGLCKSGKLDKAVEIVEGMWNHGSAALCDLVYSFIGLVDNNDNGEKCVPDLTTYTTIINALCKVGRLEEAKRKFVEMMAKNIQPDSIIYDSFIHNFCKHGKIAAAFRILKDMEKKGCNKGLQTYNSLILGLGTKHQIFEIYGLIDEMREKGISPNVCTYNNVIKCLCEGGKTKEAPYLLDEMLQMGISPNISSFRLLIKAFCKECDFGVAQEVFDIATSVCGHNEVLYSLLFNEFLTRGKVLEARQLFESAVDRCLNIGNFMYKDLIVRLCKDDYVDGSRDILNKMITKGYGFDTATFIPVIDGLRKKGNKHESDKLAETMMEMASEDRVEDKFYVSNRKSTRRKPKKYDGNDWQTIVHRDDGSGLALKTLKQVQKGWGQASVSILQPTKNYHFDYPDDTVCDRVIY